MATPFNASAWLQAFTSIGGGYILGSDRRLHLITSRVEDERLAAAISDVADHPDRIEAIRNMVELGQGQEA